MRNGINDDPRVDRYIEAAATFAQPILRHLRTLFHQACPKATETIKWSKPVFVQQGVILGHLAAFQHHCVLSFWGSEMQQAVAADGFEASSAMGTLGPFQSLADLPADSVILRHMRMAADLVETGLRTKSLERSARTARQRSNSALVVTPQTTRRRR